MSIKSWYLVLRYAHSLYPWMSITCCFASSESQLSTKDQLYSELWPFLFSATAIQTPLTLIIQPLKLKANFCLLWCLIYSNTTLLNRTILLPELWIETGLIGFSGTRLGYFWKVLATNYLTKVKHNVLQKLKLLYPLLEQIGQLLLQCDQIGQFFVLWATF